MGQVSKRSSFENPQQLLFNLYSWTLIHIHIYIYMYIYIYFLYIYRYKYIYIHIYLYIYIQVNFDMTDSMGPGNLVRHIHMTNT